jgi:hypothetical protein
MMTARRVTWIVALVPLPVLIVTALFCVDTFAAGIWRRFLYPPSHLTLADALILRNTGEVVFQLLEGVDPNEPSLLVRTAPGGRPRRVLPLEAAVLTGEIEFLDLLASHGARMDDALLVRLRCQADRIGENRIVDWMDARLGRSVDCDP